MNTVVPFPSAVPARSALIDRALVTAFLENIPDKVYFKDRESRFIAASQSTCMLHGCSPADLVGKTDFDTFAGEHAQAAYDDEQRIIATGQPLLGKLEKESWPDGRVTWVMTSKLPLRDETGDIIGTFGVSQDVTARVAAEHSLEKVRQDLIETSRLAGMAEVATGVLHNVGNVLTSLNLSSSLIATGLRQSKAESLGKLSALLREHAADLGPFLSTDPRGRRIPEFIETLATHAIEERHRLLAEVDSLQKNVDHIREIVVMQQAYATMVGVVEPLNAVELMEDSVRMNSGVLSRHAVRIVRDFHPAPLVEAERGKVLQILVNVIRNAKHATDDGGAADKIITLRIAPGSPGRVVLSVQDNGVGIAPENLARIFAHGFTTRKDGHGFGLHSSANAAKKMKGSVTVQSDGLGRGAAFTLDLPAATSTTP